MCEFSNSLRIARARGNMTGEPPAALPPAMSCFTSIWFLSFKLEQQTADHFFFLRFRLIGTDFTGFAQFHV
jgi:hypothetical protein